MGEVALSMLLKYWQYGVIALLALAGWHLSSRANHWHDVSVESQAGRKADQLAYTKAQEQALADNRKTVADTEAKWKKVSEAAQETYNAKIADARTAVADYARRMLNTSHAAASPPGSAGVSSPPDPTAVSGRVGEDTLVPVSVGDLNICADNTLKAQGWQDFWKDVVAAQPK